MIWERAVWNQTCVPEAHFFVRSKWFEVYQDTEEQDPNVDKWIEEESQYQLSSEDKSGCTQDSGLWNACKESRAAVIRIRLQHEKYLKSTNVA